MNISHLSAYSQQQTSLSVEPQVEECGHGHLPRVVLSLKSHSLYCNFKHVKNYFLDPWLIKNISLFCIVKGTGKKMEELPCSKEENIHRLYVLLSFYCCDKYNNQKKL